MVDISFSVPEEIHEWIEDQVREWDYANAGDYVRALVLRERRHQAEKRVAALIHEGLESGPATPMTKEDWQEIREEGMRRLRERQRERGDS